MLAHALRALKDAYPDLRVTVATRPVFRAFFTGLDLGFMDVDIKGVHHSLRGMWRLAPMRGAWGWMPWPTCTACCAR